MSPLIPIPERVLAACKLTPEGRAWLRELPHAIGRLQDEWRLSLEAPFDEGFELSCSWVAPATRYDGTPAILKLGMPHTEARHEIAGLRFWAGDPTVHLLEADESANAMLLERCEAGRSLRMRPEEEQDVVLAGLLRRLWREPGAGECFRPLREMTDAWHAAAAARIGQAEAAEHIVGDPKLESFPDVGLAREGLAQLDALARSAPVERLLATDLHAGNVLAATRKPWLAIDPKPFVGDPAYDATQHLLNCPERLRVRPLEPLRRFADLLEVDALRVRGWLFARVASGLGTGRAGEAELARSLAP